MTRAWRSTNNWFSERGVKASLQGGDRAFVFLARGIAWLWRLSTMRYEISQLTDNISIDAL